MYYGRIRTMENFKIKDSYNVNDLFALVARLRDPETGCAWDKVQTHESIRKNFIEETYEVCDAIDKGDLDLLKEELGDVLLQVALHAEMERQLGHFDIADVADGVCKKLVLRHPHVFGEIVAKDSDTVLTNWEAIKRKEKDQKTGADSVLDVPRALPALMRSQKVQKRAGYVGFDYENAEQAMSDLRSEVDELCEAIRGDTNVEEEIGDLLFAAVNVSRFQKLDAEQALEKACDKFTARFLVVEKLAADRGVDMKTAGIDDLNALWAEAKKQVISDAK